MKIFKTVICIILILIVVCAIVDVVGRPINPRSINITLTISSIIYSISIGFIVGYVLSFIIVILGGKDYIFKDNKFQIIDKE